MDGERDSYLAWDGIRYPGTPPLGWFLATDNRWWPPQELISDGAELDDLLDDHLDPDEIDDHLADPHQEPSPPPDTASPHTPDQQIHMPEMEQQLDLKVPDSWAPEAGQPPEVDWEEHPPPSPRSRRPERTAGGGQSPTGGGSRRGFRGKFFIPLLLFLGFRAITAGSSDGTDDLVEDASDLEISTEPSRLDLAILSKEARAFLVIDECGGGVLVGELISIAANPTAFDLVINVDEVGPDDILTPAGTVSVRTPVLQPQQSWLMDEPLPESLSDLPLCEVNAFEANPI